MKCGCLLEPPTFDLPPPPDPSLVWHLLSKEKFEPVEQCEQNPFVKITDTVEDFVPDLSTLEKYHGLLAAITIFAVLCTFCICIAAFKKITRERTKKSATKTISSDAILTAGDSLWTYNSMKNQQTGVFMYCDNSIKGSRNFSHTPATMRSYIAGTPIIGANGVPHSESTTLRMYPNDRMAYHTVGRTAPSEHYEEIAAVGTIGYVHPRHTPATMARVSLRRPPPTCRPPPVPQMESRNSDSSLEHELNRIPMSESPPGDPLDKIRSRGSLETGRESGYGTAPSCQWRSPPGSSRDDSDVSRSPYVVAQSQLHSMTYV